MKSLNYKGRLSWRRPLTLGVQFGGAGLLLLAGFLPWFSLPVDILHNDGVCEVVLQPTVYTPYFQAASVGFACAWLAALPLRLRSLSDRGLPAACLMLLAVLLFPHFVVMWDADVSGRAAWLQVQFENMTWVGGDINTSFEYIDAAFKQHVYLVDSPRQIEVFKTPTWPAEHFGFNRLPAVVEWLGYTDAFCQFARPGWLAALIGSGAVLLGSLFTRHSLDARIMSRAFLSLTAACCGAAAAAMIGPFAAQSHLETGAAHAAVGDYEAALDELKAAERYAPALRHDTYFVAQRGLLELRTGQGAAPFGALYEANRLERLGEYKTALDAYRKVAATYADHVAVRREATRAVLRSAVHALNGGRFAEAEREFRETLHIDPCHLKARYGLQLTLLRRGDYEGVLQEAAIFDDLCRTFRFPSRKMIASAAQQHAYLAAYRSGDMTAAWRRWLQMRFPGYQFHEPDPAESQECDHAG